MVKCIYCSTAVIRTRPAVFCEACKRNAHTSCASKSVNILHVISNVPGTSWKCADCRNNCLCINENNINAVLDTKIESSLNRIRSEIESIRKDLLSQTVKEVQPPADPPRYSEVLRNKTQPAIVIRPKNANQSVVQTRSDILKSVNPVEANLLLGKVRDIKEVTGINPRVRLVGMTKTYSEEQINNYLLKSNPEVFCGDLECKQYLKRFRKLTEFFSGIFHAEQYNYVHNENEHLLDLAFSNAICFVEHATDPLVYRDIHHPAIVTVKNLPVTKENDRLYRNFTILDYCVAKVKKMYTYKYPPWYSRHLIQTLKQKPVAFRQFKQTGNIRYQVEFQKLRSELKTQASAAYQSDISKNSSTFWSFVNRKTNNHGIPKYMLDNEQSMTNPKDISGAFAEYFGSMYISPSLSDTSDTCGTASYVTALSLPSVQEMDVVVL
nr:unnamed protein product [Callosobruchus analis]